MKAFDLDTEAAVAALRWWRDAGVDLPVDEGSHDRFGDNWLPSSLPPANTSRPGELSRAGSNALVGEFAMDTAAAAFTSLEALRAAMDAFEGCALKKTAMRLVFGDGCPDARVMLVGEAPGAEEDRTGKPFVGRAGQLLDRMLACVGLDRTQVYIANVIPWRPPGNRTPTPQETQTCLPFIRRQIALVAPEILVCLGSSATQTLLGSREGITRVRGRWFDYVCDDGRKLRALAMLHPAYLLRQPGQKRNAWADLRALGAQLSLAKNQDMR